MSKSHDAYPSLHTHQPTDGKEVTVAFGFIDGQETAAFWVGDEKGPALFLSREALVEAAANGWGECPNCGEKEAH